MGDSHHDHPCAMIEYRGYKLYLRDNGSVLVLIDPTAPPMEIWGTLKEATAVIDSMSMDGLRHGPQIIGD